MIKGKPVSEALKLTNKAVVEALDGLPPVKVHCSVLAEQAIGYSPGPLGECPGAGPVRWQRLHRPGSGRPGAPGPGGARGSGLTGP